MEEVRNHPMYPLHDGTFFPNDAPNNTFIKITPEDFFESFQIDSTCSDWQSDVHKMYLESMGFSVIRNSTFG